MIESLEPRQLLTVIVTLNEGVLTITGDSADDRVRVEVDSSGDLVVESDRQPLFSTEPQNVTAIQADLDGGDDEFETSGINAPITVRGGTGNDKLQGGEARDEVFGDKGNDQLNTEDGAIDRVDGGTDDDVAKVDATDVATDVETLDVRDVQVNDAEFIFDTPPAQPMELAFTFNQDVSEVLDVGDLVLVNLTTGQTVPAGFIALSFDTTNNLATFRFPGFANGILPDGDYEATIIASGLSGASGGMTGDFHTDFFFIQGDANHDHEVDFDDYVLIDNGYNNGLTGFSNGDFNYDGVIDFDDYVLIDLAFNSQ